MKTKLLVLVFAFLLMFSVYKVIDNKGMGAVNKVYSQKNELNNKIDDKYSEINNKNKTMYDLLDKGANIPPDIERIIRRGKLIVGMYYQDKAPFFMVDENGDMQGVDVEIAKDIGRNFGVKVEFNRQAKTFDRLFQMAATGEVDIVISNFSNTPERNKYIIFSKPYVTLQNALLVNRKRIIEEGVGTYPIDYLKNSNSNNCKIGVTEKSSFVEIASDLFGGEDKVVEMKYAYLNIDNVKKEAILQNNIIDFLSGKKIISKIADDSEGNVSEFDLKRQIESAIIDAEKSRNEKLLNSLIKIKKVSSKDTLLEKVKKGELAAVLHDGNETTKIIRQNPDVIIDISAYTLKDQKDLISIGMAWDKTQLLQWINNYLDMNDINYDINDLYEMYPQCYESN